MGTSTVSTDKLSVLYFAVHMTRYHMLLYAVFCPGFHKGRVPSQKGTFRAVNGPSKGHISAVNGRKGAQLAR